MIDIATLNLYEANKLGYDAEKLLLASYFANLGKARTCLQWIVEDLELSGYDEKHLPDLLWELDGDYIITITGSLNDKAERFTVEPNMCAPLFWKSGLCVQVGDVVIHNAVRGEENTYHAFGSWLVGVLYWQGADAKSVSERMMGEEG